MGIKVRIPPSPTGFMHIGTARTALFNWLFAKHNNGKVILRIEDTDIERSEKKYEEDIIEGLKWLGIEWDEFYRQSERIEIYKKYIQKLLNEEKAFWCYHSVDELEKEKEEQIKRKEAPRHICSHKYEKPEGKSGGIIRLAVDEHSTRVIHFDDTVRGTVEFEQRVIGDLSIAKDEDTPLYNFAVIVDDYEMEISHVIRGEDHIPNTPKQILIIEALEFPVPQYAHMPLILGPDKSKLSKRHGAASLIEYREQGFLPNALLNFMALLGWTPKGDREILSREELIEEFKLEEVHKSGAIFDMKKLMWMNGEYIKKSSTEKLKKLITPFAEKHFGSHLSEDLLDRIIHLVQERIQTLDQIKEFHFFFKDPNYERDLLIWKKGHEAHIKRALGLIKEVLSGDAEWKVFNEHYIRKELDGLAMKYSHGERGEVYWPLRVALSGEKYSPDPVHIMSVLGKEKTFQRINKAIEKLK